MPGYHAGPGNLLGLPMPIRGWSYVDSWYLARGYHPVITPDQQWRVYVDLHGNLWQNDIGQKGAYPINRSDGGHGGVLGGLFDNAVPIAFIAAIFTAGASLSIVAEDGALIQLSGPGADAATTAAAAGGTAAAANAASATASASAAAANTASTATNTISALIGDAGNSLLGSLGDLTGSIGDFVTSARDTLTGILGPIADTVNQVANIARTINEQLIQPIVGPIQSIIANYKALTDVLNRDLSSGITGILKIPGDIANALTSVDASFQRAIAQLGAGNSDLVSKLLIPALVGKSGKALGDLHPLFASALAPASERFSAPPAFALTGGTDLSPWLKHVSEEADKLYSSDNLFAVGLRFAMSAGAVLADLLVKWKPFYELAEEQTRTAAGIRKFDPATVLKLYTAGEVDHASAVAELRTHGFSEERVIALLNSTRELFTTGQVVDLYRRRYIDNVTAEAMLATQGWIAEDIRTLLDSSPSEMSESMLIELTRRKLLSPQEAQVSLERQGYRQLDAQLMVSTAFHLLGAQDIIALHDRASIESRGAGFAALSSAPPQSFSEYASELGINDEAAQVLWSNHWQLLSPALACQAYFRGYINRTQLDQCLAAASIPPELHNNYVDLQRPQLPARMIVSMMGKGALSELDAMTALERLGYDQVSANTIVSANRAATKPTHAAVSAHLHGLTQATVLQLYDAGTIDKGHAGAMLAGLGWDGAAVDATLQLHDVRAAHTERMAEVEVILANVRAGVLDTETAMGELGKLNLTNAELEKALAKLTTARTLQAKLPTEAQLLAMHKAGIVDDVETTATLKAMGYSDTWSARLIQLEASRGTKQTAARSAPSTPAAGS